jgi:hypothetical protein
VPLIPGAQQLFAFCQEIENCTVGHHVDGDSLRKNPPGRKPPPGENDDFGPALRWLDGVSEPKDEVSRKQSGAPVKAPISLWVPVPRR